MIKTRIKGLLKILGVVSLFIPAPAALASGVTLACVGASDIARIETQFEESGLKGSIYDSALGSQLKTAEHRKKIGIAISTVGTIAGVFLPVKVKGGLAYYALEEYSETKQFPDVSLSKFLKDGVDQLTNG